MSFLLLPRTNALLPVPPSGRSTAVSRCSIAVLPLLTQSNLCESFVFKEDT